MPDDVLFAEIKMFLDSQVQCVLATLDIDQPCLHLMAYDFSDDLSEVYLASYADTRKVENMRAQPNVSLLWDNRTGNTKDHVEGAALNASGKAYQVEGIACTQISNRLKVRNTTLAALLESDNAAIFVVRVSGYVYVKGYTDVYQYSP